MEQFKEFIIFKYNPENFDGYKVYRVYQKFSIKSLLL